MQFNDNKDRLKKKICQNIMEQSNIKDDIIEYKKDTAEVSARIIGYTKDGIKGKGNIHSGTKSNLWNVDCIVTMVPYLCSITMILMYQT